MGLHPPGQPINPLGGPMGDIDDDGVGSLDDHFHFEIRLSISSPGRTPVFGDGVDVFDSDADVDLGGFADFPHALAR